MIQILEKENGQSLKQYVYQTLSQNIVRLNLKPGEKLIEAEISKLLGISRTPIREALLELSEKKIVDIIPGNGTFVSYIDMDIVSQFLYLRTVIERDLSKIACDLITSDDIDYLHELIAIQKYYYEAQKPHKLLEYDIKFHSAIYRICNKEFLNNLILSLSVHFDRIRYLSMTRTEFILKISEHEEYLRALTDHNPDLAMKISDEHMVHTFEDFRWISDVFPQYISQKKTD